MPRIWVTITDPKNPDPSALPKQIMSTDVAVIADTEADDDLEVDEPMVRLQGEAITISLTPGGARTLAEQLNSAVQRIEDDDNPYK